MAGQSQADSNVPLLDQIPIQPEDPDVQSSAVVATSQGVAETSTFESQYADSAFDAESVAATTKSTSSSLFEVREENGRVYHVKRESYFLPTDEKELDRQDFQNHTCLMTFNQKLSFAPFGKVDRALDIGTGTGIWAIEFAELYPGTVVIGIDLIPIQPLMVPPNLIFEIDDLELDWTFSQNFDYIHSRMMAGAIKDWPRFCQQSFDFLNSGGHLEIQDIEFPIRCDDNSMLSTSPLWEWSRLMLEANARLGRPLNICGRTKEMMVKAGFVDLAEIPFTWPQNRWPTDKKYKNLGRYVQENFISGIDAMSLALFTRVLGWSFEETTVFLAQVKNDIRNPSIHAYWRLYVVYGRKP